MNVCFPVTTNTGVDSNIYGHFASSPLFMIIDTTTRQGSVIVNCDRDNPFAGCNPFSALRGRQLDGIIVDAIGDDAVRAMNLCGFSVYQASSTSVAENLKSFATGALHEILVQQSHREGRCASDESGHTCNHHLH